jgi:hypothetical protein
MSDSAAGPGAREGGADPAGAAAGPAGRGGDEQLDPRVAEVLQSLRSGVRQRQAEAATMGGAPGGARADGGLAAGLLAVRSHEYVQEPVAFSHRARFGKLIVFARKAFFHLFLKWFHRPLLAQQNAFNQSAGQLLQELAEAVERLARETRLQAARLADLEARQAGEASVRAGEGARAGESDVGGLGDAGGLGRVAGGPGAAARRDPPP